MISLQLNSHPQQKIHTDMIKITDSLFIDPFELSAIHTLNGKTSIFIKGSEDPFVINDPEFNVQPIIEAINEYKDL